MGISLFSFEVAYETPVAHSHFYYKKSMTISFQVVLSEYLFVLTYSQWYLKHLIQTIKFPDIIIVDFRKASSVMAYSPALVFHQKAVNMPVSISHGQWATPAQLLPCCFNFFSQQVVPFHLTSIQAPNHLLF